MSLWSIIPTCNDLMSVYTLATFAAYTIILGIGGKFAISKFNKQENVIETLSTSVGLLSIEVAVLNERLGNVESAIIDMRTDMKDAISSINQTLLDRLPGKQ